MNQKQQAPHTQPAQAAPAAQPALAELELATEPQLTPEQQAEILRQQETDQLKAVAEAAAEAMAKQDPRLVEGEVKLQKAKIRRENAAMVQSCAMALFAGLSAVAVGLGMYSGRKAKGTAPAAIPQGPAVK